MITVGTQVRRTWTTYDLAGTAVDATVTYTATRPDGTTTSPAVTDTGVGTVKVDLTVDQAGEWTEVWTASGTVIAVHRDQFTAIGQRLLVASLTQLKKQMRREDPTDTDDDEDLVEFLTASTEAVEELTGTLIGRSTVTEYHHISGGLITPHRRPIVSVTSITPDYLGGAVVDPVRYTVDAESETIHCRFASRGRFQLVYVAGLTTIPARYRKGGIIIAQHLWMVENGGAGAPFPGETTMVAGLGYAIPNRAIELLNPDLLAGIA